MDIRYLGGSGFLVSMGTTGLVFDASDLGEFPGTLPDKELLSGFSRLFVFISQTDERHYTPAIKDLCGETAEYIVSDDFPAEFTHRLSVGDTLELDGLTVTAYDSTDEGVSFLVHTAGVNIFHAGSLNLWHWRDISSIMEIEAAENDFNNCLSTIPKNVIDLAFFPIDPRQGSMFDAGAGSFLMTVKPRLLIPMYFQDRTDAAHYFAATNETNTTRISVLEHAGDHLQITFPGEELSEASDEENSGTPAEAQGENPLAVSAETVSADSITEEETADVPALENAPLEADPPVIHEDTSSVHTDDV